MARVDKKAPKTHVLTQEEADYLLLLNRARMDAAMQAHTNMSGFMSYIAKNRLGYESVGNLQFEYDPEAKQPEIKITELDQE